MPILLAGLLRYLVMAALNTAVVSSAFVILDKGIEWITGQLMNDEGMTREQAEDSIASEIVAIGGAAGANAALLKSRLPVRLADKLKRSSKRPSLSPSGREILGIKTPPAKLGILRGIFAKSPWAIFGTSLLTSLPWWPSLVQNFLDQGTFNPINANAALRDVGLGGVFQWSIESRGAAPASYTASEFSELFNQLTAAGAVGINNEFEQQSQLLSKDALAELINVIVGTAIMYGEKSDKTAIKKELSKYLIMKGGSTLPVSPSPAMNTMTPRTAPPVSTARVFTGVLANGVLGVSKPFESVGDGYITSNDDLMLTASQTLSGFLAGLPGKFNYEIAIVNSFRSPGGFTLKGESVQVVSSYLKDGTPRYKTIYKKFAVLKVWIIDKNGRKVDLLEENMGQVNSTDFNPTPQQLKNVSASITAAVFSKDVNDIRGIINDVPVLVSSPAPVSTQTADDKARIATEIDRINASARTPELEKRIAEAPQTQRKFYSFVVNGEVYPAVVPYTGNIPSGHTELTASRWLEVAEAFRARHPIDGHVYATDADIALARSVLPNALGGGASGFVMIDGVAMNKA